MTLVEAIDFVLRNADFQDEGYGPHCYRSNEMVKAEDVLYRFVKSHEEGVKEDD